MAADVVLLLSVRALRDWGVSMASESSVVSFPAGKPAQTSAKNRVSKSPNYHLEQLIALRDQLAEGRDYRLCDQAFALTAIGLSEKAPSPSISSLKTSVVAAGGALGIGSPADRSDASTL